MTLPFYLAYIAPDVVTLCDPCLHTPPTFAHDGAHLIMLIQGDAGDTAAGRVRAVHQAGAVAVVELDHLTYEDDPALTAVVLVRADTLPMLAPIAHLAARLRTTYGDSLTVRQVAVAGVVTTTAIYQAISRGRLASSKQGRRRMFTPEQAAAWLVERGSKTT